MSVSQPETAAAVLPDFSSMTEEEQIAYAMQMSLAGGGQLEWTTLHVPAIIHGYSFVSVGTCVGVLKSESIIVCL